MDDLPRFYQPDVQIGETFALAEEESRHAKVLRLQSSQIVHVVNGKGQLFTGSIQPQKRGFDIEVLKLVMNEERSINSFTLAVAPTKNMNRFEWVIEKAVEVGVLEIIPIRCENSERVHLKLDRLDKIAISALKQSKALWKTEIHELTEFDQIINNHSKIKWMAHCQPGEKSHLRAICNSSESQIVCIGPEGDFSQSEISKATNCGFKSLSLGSQRLRTETAAITVCIAANLFRP